MGGDLAVNGYDTQWAEVSASALTTLLALTSDAVLVFDGSGVVSLANDVAGLLFGRPLDALMGKKVHTLFVESGYGVAGDAATLAEQLPFTLDGNLHEVGIRGGSAYRRVVVRCEAVTQDSNSYILVLHPGFAHDQALLERERLVDELTRANKRLSGTMQIVLGTLDALDVGTLLKRTLSEVNDTLESWMSLAYVADDFGYHLMGMTPEAAGAATRLPKVFATSHPLVVRANARHTTSRFTTLSPTRDQLREGTLSHRSVQDLDTGEVFEVDATNLLPFGSFFLTPVWFSGHMISLFCVGYSHTHLLRKDDARLLDGVADYLSVQLAGAFAAMRSQYEERLESSSTRLRERMLSVESFTREVQDSVFGEAADVLGSRLMALVGNPYQKTTVSAGPVAPGLEVPFDLKAESKRRGDVFCCRTNELEALEAWVEEFLPASACMLVSVGEMEGAFRAYLFIRDEDDEPFEPFEEIDMSYLTRLAEDVRSVAAGERARSRDKHISEALMNGMRNELQKVEGIEAESRYSSATEAAYVGGDFYDLVRLPHHKACIILGDVSGKGVEAASVSAAVKTALSAYAFEGLSPARSVELLNELVLGFSRIETFATMFVGLADIDNHTLTYCSAGHPPALLVRAKDTELVTLGVQSGVVGAFENMHYQDGVVKVSKDDILILYTDGVTEARNPDGAFFGEDGLRDIVAQEAAVGFSGIVDRMIERVSDFSGGSLEDDVALVAVCFDA